MTKATLIIGGSSGIGLATAKLLAGNDRTIIITGRDEAKLADAARAIEAVGGGAETVRVDLFDNEAVNAFTARIDTDARHIDQLVNAAGYFFPKPFLEHERADYDIYHDLNRATFFLTQAIARNMVRHGGGAIVNIGSMWARQSIKATPSSAYSMAKAGLHSLTQHLAMELAEHKIRVNAVAPAVVVTPIHGAFIDPAAIASTLAAGFDAFHPIGRVARRRMSRTILPSCFPRRRAGPPAQSMMSMAVSWPVVTERAKPCTIMPTLRNSASSVPQLPPSGKVSMPGTRQ